MHTSVVDFRKERTDRRSTLLLGAMGTYLGKQLSIMTPLLGYGERQTIFLQIVAHILLHAGSSVGIVNELWPGRSGIESRWGRDFSVRSDRPWGPCSVGIATGLWPGRSGIESRWGRDFPPDQTGPGAHAAFCKMGTGSFPGVKCGRGMLLTTHPLLGPRSCKNRSILLPTHWVTPGL